MKLCWLSTMSRASLFSTGTTARNESVVTRASTPSSQQRITFAACVPVLQPPCAGGAMSVFSYLFSVAQAMATDSIDTTARFEPKRFAANASYVSKHEIAVSRW